MGERRIRGSESGRSEVGIGAGIALIFIGVILLAIDSSAFTSWSWATSGTFAPYGGICPVVLFLFGGGAVAIWA